MGQIDSGGAGSPRSGWLRSHGHSEQSIFTFLGPEVKGEPVSNWETILPLARRLRWDSCPFALLAAGAFSRRGTSFHRSVELAFPPIAFDPSPLSCRHGLPGPAEL